MKLFRKQQLDLEAFFKIKAREWLSKFYPPDGERETERESEKEICIWQGLRGWDQEQ